MVALVTAVKIFAPFDDHQPMGKFLFRLLTFCAAIVGLWYGAAALFPAFTVKPFYFYSLLYFSVLHAWVFFLHQKSAGSQDKNFVYSFYTATIIRMFGSAAFLIISVLSMDHFATADAIVFIILYFLFTAFEIINILPTLRHNFKGNLK